MRNDGEGGTWGGRKGRPQWGWGRRRRAQSPRPTSGVVAAMVPKIASNSDQTARSHRSWEVGMQRIAMPHAMPTLGRATLLSSARDRKVGEEWGGGDRAYTVNYA